MKILFITSRLPYPPNRGDRLRAFNFIKSLCREHEIHLITFISSDTELQHIPVLKNYCRSIQYIKKKSIQSAISVLFNFWRSEPLQSLYYRSSEMSRLIDHALDVHKFEVLFVHLFRMAQFVINHQGQYRILDLTDVISNEINRSLPYRSIFWKLLYSNEYTRIARQERKLANQFEEIWLISSADHKILATLAPEANIVTITNGIDTGIFHPLDVDPVDFRLIFTGHMGIAHNIDAARYFALDIFPNVQKMFPESRYVIAGAEPAKPVLDLSSNPNVKVLGYVEDLNYELNRSQIFVAPLRFAAGIQNKVLEAMAAGIPVVTTRIVNEGINAAVGEEILIADTPDEFLAQLSRLFKDEALRKKISRAGSDFVQNNFSWDIVLQRMNSIEAMLYQDKKTDEILSNRVRSES